MALLGLVFGPSLAVTYSALVVMSVQGTGTPTQAIGAATVWASFAGCFVAYRFRDRVAPGWKGAIVLYGAMGVMGMFVLLVPEPGRLPPWVWPLLMGGFFVAVYLYAYLTRRDTEIPLAAGRDGEPETIPPDVRRKRRILALSVAVAAIATGVTLAQAGVFTPHGPTPGYSSFGSYVWVPLGTTTTPVTLAGDGPLFIVASQDEAPSPGINAPALATRAELRLNDGAPAHPVRADIKVDGEWHSTRLTGGQNGTWVIEDDGNLAGNTLRVWLQAAPAYEDRRMTLHVAFQVRGVVECGRYTWQDGTTKDECKPLRYPA